MQITDFDATNIAPQQMGDRHPVGMFPFQITNTYGVQNKNSQGGQFVVEFTSPSGTITNRYNLWNPSQQAVEIAQKELSALCHAVGVFKLSFTNVDAKDYGRELRGARGSMKVDLQDANKPDGYVEVKKIFDINGNEPGKAPSGAPQTQQGNWGNQQQPQQQQQPPQNNNAGGGWNNNQPQNQQPAQQGQPQQGGSWSPGPSNNQQPQGGSAPQGASSPPWSRN